MIILLPSTTCSPFLTHTTEGGLELPMPTHLNTRLLLPTGTADRLSGKPSLSLSAGFVTTVSVLVLAAGKEDHEPNIKEYTPTVNISTAFYLYHYYSVGTKA